MMWWLLLLPAIALPTPTPGPGGSCTVTAAVTSIEGHPAQIQWRVGPVGGPLPVPADAVGMTVQLELEAGDSVVEMRARYRHETRVVFDDGFETGGLDQWSRPAEVKHRTRVYGLATCD
jgi:hypothetical protein